MACDTIQGSFISMDLKIAGDCSTSGTVFNDTVELILPLEQDRDNITTQVRVRSFGEWTVTQDVFDAPRADDACGAFRRKRFGCDKDHSAWDAEIEWPTALVTPTSTNAGQYDLSLLVGAEGTIRRTQPDGSYWQGEGRIVSATPLPSGAPNEEMLGSISVQWRGGSPTDPKYFKPTAP